jgi:nucleotide-binding universal stress UspA family protein
VLSRRRIDPAGTLRLSVIPSDKKRTTFRNEGRARMPSALQASSMTAEILEDERVIERPQGRPLRLKKILVPIDFSPPSKNAFKYAVRFAEEFGGELTLLYVLEPQSVTGFMPIPEATAFVESDIVAAGKNLRSLIASVRNARIDRPRWKVRGGLPSHEIVEAAKEMDVDLIVIATHGYTGWKHFCIGSTAERVVRAAPCPVLVVREKQHEFC